MAESSKRVILQASVRWRFPCKGKPYNGGKAMADRSAVAKGCRKRQRRLPREYGVWRLIGFGSVGLGLADRHDGRGFPDRGRM